MRKNLLSLSIATMIGGMGVAHASLITDVVGAPPVAAATVISLAAGGVGHALITPYFTANNGNATVISLVNTDTVRGKAVKVRFRGAANSDDILDFQVYMSPSDHWSGIVTKNASTGIAQFTTNDNTCTLPAFTKGTAQSFITGRLPSYATATELGNHTTEGYIEIFNMADIPVNTTDTKTLYASILHTAGTPRDCSATALTGLVTTNHTAAGTAVTAGLASPTTGLMGNWTIINVAQTTTFSGSMTAIRALTAAGGTDGYGNFVLYPQSDADASAVVAAGSADPLFSTANAVVSVAANGDLGAAAGSVAVTPAFYDLPDLSTPYVGVGVTPQAYASTLTTALAVKSITNEYSTDPTVSASTDWTFAMPTRRYSVAVKYSVSAGASSLQFSKPVVGSGGDITKPFFHASNTTKAATSDRICVSADSQKFYDREEGGKSTGAVFSPGSVAVIKFCGEDSVISFGSAPVSVLGATIANLTTGSSAFVSGWGYINTDNSGRGLPIMGSSFIKLTNPAASAGVSGTYGITSDHRFSQ